MSADIDNTGFCQFGSAPDTPDATGVVFPPKSGRCKLHVKYKSKAKLHKAAGSGKSDAKITFTGKEVGDVEITIKWADLDPTAGDMEQALLALSPRGPNAGKAWEWTERWAGIHDAASVIVEELEGPEPTEGTDELTAKIKCSTWTKPSASGAGAGTSSTPIDPAKWTAKGGTVQGFGGDPNNAVNFPTAPKVVPNP